MNRILRSGAPLALAVLFAPLACPGAALAQHTGLPLAEAPQNLGALEIVSPRRASALVAEERLHILDTRPVGRYLAGHLPGAVHLDDERLRGSVNGLPAQYLPEHELGRLFESAGVTTDKPVLVYSDGEDPLAATMTAYGLLKAGHPRVMILDGGFEAWRGNEPVTQAFPTYTTTPWKGQSRAALLTASIDDAQRASDSGLGTLVDARPARVYRGEGKPWTRNGHIPRAISLDWTGLMRADNGSLFKPRKDIEKMLADAGLRKEDPIIVYCGTGREATLLYLYLRSVLEWPRVRLYEGSWTEWSSKPDFPVAAGDADPIALYSDGRMHICAQPDEETLRMAADRGVSLVINCRTGRETTGIGFNEAALAKRLGMTYTEIPMGGTEGYSPEQVEALRRILADHPDGQILMHCASGARSAQLWVAYLVQHKGLTVEQAEQRAREAGMLRDTTLTRLLGGSTQRP